jgi:hypothetical protein
MWRFMPKVPIFWQYFFVAFAVQAIICAMFVFAVSCLGGPSPLVAIIVLMFIYLFGWVGLCVLDPIFGYHQGFSDTHLIYCFIVTLFVNSLVLAGLVMLGRRIIKDICE